jgi:hypothetical protein
MDGRRAVDDEDEDDEDDDDEDEVASADAAVAEAPTASTAKADPRAIMSARWRCSVAASACVRSRWARAWVERD